LPNCEKNRENKTFMSKVYDWFEERLEVQAIADDIRVNMFRRT